MFLQLKGLKKIYEEEKRLEEPGSGDRRGVICDAVRSLRLRKDHDPEPSGRLYPAGFRPYPSGREDITGLPPERRPVSTVFQSYALFPHLNVLDNVCYGLGFSEG